MLPIQYTIRNLINYAHYLHKTVHTDSVSISAKMLFYIKHSRWLQRASVCFTLAALRPVCSLCVWCVEMVGLSMAAAAGSTVALITQVLQVLGGKKRTFLCLDQRAQRECMLRQSRKLIGYTYLVCLCLFGPLFFPSFH